MGSFPTLPRKVFGEYENLFSKINIKPENIEIDIVYEDEYQVAVRVDSAKEN